jgi:hypothetical protein
MHEKENPAARSGAGRAEGFNLIEQQNINSTRRRTAPEANSAEDRRALRLLSFKPIAKNGLAGFASVELGIGLRLFDLPVFSSGQAGPWVGLPRRPSLDRDQRQRIGADGKPAFEAVAEWRDHETANRFSAAVIELIRATYPDALAGGSQ